MFAETLWITVWGVSLTFFAMGIIVLSMIGLTKWAVPRKRSQKDAAQPESAAVDVGLEESLVAAAAAVALAQAEADQRARVPSKAHQIEQGRPLWQSYTRAQKLDQRKVHQALR